MYIIIAFLWVIKVWLWKDLGAFMLSLLRWLVECGTATLEEVYLLSRLHVVSG